MPTKDDKTPETTEPPAEETAPEETAFWDKLDEKIKTGVGAAIEEKLAAFRENSNSRTGRKTLPGFIADFMFEKPKPPKS